MFSSCVGQTIASNINDSGFRSVAEIGDNLWLNEEEEKRNVRPKEKQIFLCQDLDRFLCFDCRLSARAEAIISYHNSRPPLPFRIFAIHVATLRSYFQHSIPLPVPGLLALISIISCTIDSPFLPLPSILNFG